jgi:hypothetical protein
VGFAGDTTPAADGSEGGGGLDPQQQLAAADPVVVQVLELLAAGDIDNEDLQTLPKNVLRQLMALAEEGGGLQSLPQLQQQQQGEADTLRQPTAVAGVGTEVQGLGGHGAGAAGGSGRARGSPANGSPRTGSCYSFAI